MLPVRRSITPFGGIEQPQIRVPLVGGGSETPIGACQPFDCGHGLRARQFFCEPLLGGFCRRPADNAHAVEDCKGIVELPAHAVLTQLLGDVAQNVGVQLGETQRERVVGECGQPLGRAPLLSERITLARCGRRFSAGTSAHGRLHSAMTSSGQPSGELALPWLSRSSALRMTRRVRHAARRCDATTAESFAAASMSLPARPLPRKTSAKRSVPGKNETVAT